MKDLNKIALITYTNSNCHDVLRVHSGQIEKFAKNFNSYVLSNETPSDEDLNKDRHNVILYDNNDPYYKHWVKCLSEIKEDYIIYLQEDFLLYDNVDYEEVLRCMNTLQETDLSFVRFGKFELSLGKHANQLQEKDFPDLQLAENIFDAYCHDPECYAFMMQASLWKKKDYVDLYSKVKADIWHEAPKWNKGMREMNMKGAFYHDETMPKLGKFHWESKIWPHVCTAVGYGKWSISHHDHRLTDILKNYNVDTNIRGTR